MKRFLIRPRKTVESRNFALAAIVFAALAGFATTVVAFRTMTAIDFAKFSVFWGWLYFAVGALSGIQQEVSRAVTSTQKGLSSSRWTDLIRAEKPVFSAIVILCLALMVIRVLTPTTTGLLLIGLTGYVFVAQIAGIAYGTQKWRTVALLVGFDGFVRLLLIVFAASLDTNVAVYELAAVVPFILIPAVFFLARGRSEERFGLDVSIRRLRSNSSKLIVSAGLTSILVAGFPALMGVTLAGWGAEQFATSVFVVTVVRAPLVIGVIALQTMLIVWLQDSDMRSQIRQIGLVAVFVVILGLLELAIVLPFGETIISLASGGSANEVSHAFFLTVVTSGVLLAVQFAFGTLLITRSNHAAYMFSWIMTVLTTIGLLVMQFSFEDRLQYALLLGPLVGMSVMAAAIMKPPRVRENQT